MIFRLPTGTRALALALALGSCVSPTDLTVRIRPPSDPTVFHELYQPDTPRCIVLAAAPIGPGDEVVHAVAVRASSLGCTAPPPGAGDACRPVAGLPRCLGAAGATLLEGLSTRTTYLVALVFFDDRDFQSTQDLTNTERYWSLYDLDPRNPPGDYVCLSDPTRSLVFRPILDAARAACRSAPPPQGPCALDFTLEPLCRDTG